MSHEPELESVLEWLGALERDRTSQQIETHAGTGLLTPAFPDAHDHNLLVLHPDVDAASAVAGADAVLGGAGLAHRSLDATRADADALAPPLAAAGYERAEELVMLFAGKTPAGAAGVDTLLPAERAQAAAADWRAESPGWEPDVWRQLGERIATLPDDVAVTFLAVRDEAGAVLARADLYLRDGTAQVEEVMTVESARGRGLASRLIADAVRRAREVGAARVFLLVDAADGPVALYGRLGFVTVGRRSRFTRPLG